MYVCMYKITSLASHIDSNQKMQLSIASWERREESS